MNGKLTDVCNALLNALADVQPHRLIFCHDADYSELEVAFALDEVVAILPATAAAPRAGSIVHLRDRYLYTRENVEQIRAIIECAERVPA